MVKTVGPISVLLLAVAATASAAPKVPVAVLHADTFTDVCSGRMLVHSDSLQMSDDKMKAGGVAVVGAAIWITNKVADPKAALAYVEKTANCIKEVAHKNPHLFVLARSPAGVETAIAGGKIALVITVEGGEAIEAGPEALQKMHDLGVRSISLTWSRDNGLAASHVTKDDTGLSPTGVAAVAEMNRLGIMVDVSHASDRTVEGMLKASRAPVHASHANARSLAKTPRNLTDPSIAAICRGGGVVGVNFHAPHVAAKGAADAADVARHAALIKKLGGAACAAIGGDLDGRIRMPEGLADASQLQNLAPAFMAAGFSAPEIEGVYFRNFIGYWNKVEAAAQKPGTPNQKETAK